MLKSYTKKISGGKLLNVYVNLLNNKISVKITGDFFLYPEDKLWLIEKSLNGLNENISLDDLIIVIDKVVNENNIEIIGFSSKDLAECILEALKLNQE